VKTETVKDETVGQSLSTDGLGDEHDYMSTEELHDKGPWHIDIYGKLIMSDNFTHDVILRITGDFYSDEQRIAYAKNLAAKLNAPNVKFRGADSVQFPVALLMIASPATSG
jgi:hypothetical protein